VGHPTKRESCSVVPLKAVAPPSSHGRHSSQGSLEECEKWWGLAADDDLYSGNVCVTLAMPALQVLEYLDRYGRSPYSAWFDNLNGQAAAKIAAASYQLGVGNFSNVKGVGKGVFERRIDFGPGYRIYFGRDGATLLILLGGSGKQRQPEAIAIARDRWTDYKQRKGTR
jgi:putative addiction module killer protein